MKHAARRGASSDSHRLQPARTADQSGGATRQIVGVPRPELTELLARALLMLGSTRAWVVHGADGIDEISTTGYTKVSECRDGAVQHVLRAPGRLRPAKAAPAALRAATPPRMRAIVRDVLAGERGPRATSCCSMRAPALFVAGRATPCRGHRAGRSGDRFGRSAQDASSGWSSVSQRGEAAA